MYQKHTGPKRCSVGVKWLIVEAWSVSQLVALRNLMNTINANAYD